MIGVTAACLMVRRKVYEEVGGLYEGLAVAYNDVDFCFNLWEKGYCNVLRNDVVLYHHESLSRGDDMQDTGKLERLKGEQRELYDRHKALYRKDPYIGTILNSGEPEYCLRWLEDFEFGEDTRIKSDLVQSGRRLPPTDKMNQAIMTVTEECGKVNPSDKGYLVKGWAYVPGVDNARYSFKLLMLDGSQKIWETPVQRRYRKDVAAILQGETNVELAGFCNWIADGTLPKGSYELWLTAKDGCSRQRLYRKMEKTLVIE
jgi:hypothetical protein